MRSALLAMLCISLGWTTAEAVGRSPLQTQPTLARLSFWVPPARMAEFEAAYAAKVAPILKAHGLTESSDRGRATPDSIFSRLFELKTPSEVADKQKALQADPTWTATLRSLGATFGAWRPDSLIQNGFLLYTTPAGPGKAVPAGRGTGHWRTYDVTDGLAGRNVRSVFQDREGNLWCGTWGSGVSRYDGQTWTTFTTRDGLVSDYMVSTFQDREGNLWFGAAGGVSRYDGKSFTTFTTKDGLAQNYVWSIIQDREGYLWFGTFGGVSRYDPLLTSGQKFTTLTTKDGLANNIVVSIFQDRDGHFWFSTWGGGVSRYDGKTWTTLTTKDGLANNIVMSIFQDRHGHFWFSTWGGGVSRYDGRAWATFTTRDGLASDYVWLITQDQEENLWFGTLEGVSRYNGQGFTTFTTEDGLASNRVQSMFQGREGHLYVGTEGGGVSQYDGQTFTTFTTKDGLANNAVSSILQDREGVLWVGTLGGGMSRYDGKTFTTFNLKDKMSEYVSGILQDREANLWFGTDGEGVIRYDGKTFTCFNNGDGLARNRVASIFQDLEGYIWFGAYGGVSRYDGQTWTTFTTKDGLVGGWVTSITQDRKGNFWFGDARGVSRYDGKTFTSLTTKDGLASGSVRSVFQDREGHLWFGADGGLSRYDGHGFTTFTREDGLASNAVSSIYQDREGHLWFGTDGGLSRYDGQVFQTLTRQDGLASNSVRSIYQDREGNLWFGTEGGMTRYRKPAPSPPPVFVDAVVADRRHEKVSELSVPSTVKLAAFEFHGISFKTRPEAMVYRYRLNGYDKDWKTTHERRVEYSNLPRGTYTFEVVAVDRDLVYSEKPATVTLLIHPPYTLMGLVAALGVALGLAVWQTARVVRRDRRLREANAALSAANKELFSLHRQATRRGAVDRMRAEVGAMRASVDLERITPTIWRELRELRVPFLRCGVFIIEEEESRLHSYLTNPEGASLGVLSLAFDSHPIVSKAVDCWRTKGSYAEEWDREALLDWVQFLEAQGQPIQRERYLDSEAPPEALSLRYVPFAQGILYVGSEAPLPEEDVGLMRDLANAFSIAYARYQDFQRLEAQNRQIQEANRLKSQFLANMSHELRTPMNAIIGFTNLVIRRAGDVLPERQRDNLRKVKLSADHLLNLINDILDLSKIEAGRVDIQKKWFDMGELIAGCCATVSPLVKEGVTLTHEVAGDVREAYSDEARLRQIVINLLSNALKFTEKGEVRVRVTRQPSLVTRSESKEIAVSDTGIGIPADALGYIFDEFRQVDGSSTRQYGGTGLGLSITKKLTELLGGTIGVESAMGKGSTFTVRIPAVYDERRGDPRGRPPATDPESPSAVSRLPSAEGEGGQGRRTIVVIDDDPNVGTLLREELAGEGYRIVSAQSADEGVALVKKIRPAAVTVDIIMPGKDGWETIAMLKGDPETRDIPIIVISASDNRELGYRLGVRDYLVKPVDREALLSALGRLDSGQLKDILVVDDEPLVTTMICQMLEFSGFAARSASNGEEALAEIGRARPDALLLDLMMPVMDGFEVIERLQADPALREVPVVVITAKDLTEGEREFLQKRVSRVIQKGRMDPMALAQDLREMLKGYER